MSQPALSTYQPVFKLRYEPVFSKEQWLALKAAGDPKDIIDVVLDFWVGYACKLRDEEPRVFRLLMARNVPDVNKAYRLSEIQTHMLKAFRDMIETLSAAQPKDPDSLIESDAWRCLYLKQFERYLVFLPSLLHLQKQTRGSAAAAPIVHRRLEKLKEGIVIGGLALLDGYFRRDEPLGFTIKVPLLTGESDGSDRPSKIDSSAGEGAQCPDRAQPAG